MSQSVMTQEADNASTRNTLEPKVVGIYGLSGSGKSTIKQHLGQTLPEGFLFYEGSEELLKPLGGNLETFKAFDKPTKLQRRTQAIRRIQQSSIDTGNVAVVTGHFSLLTKQVLEFEKIWVPADGDAYDLIVYLEVSPKELADRIHKDKSRPDREVRHAVTLGLWQEREINDLRTKCYANKTLIVTVKNDGTDSAEATITNILKAFKSHNEADNSKQVSTRLESIFGPALKQNEPKRSDAVLVFDGDKTLAPQDSGELMLPDVSSSSKNTPLKQVFSSDMGYSFAAWTQAALLYDALGNEEAFDKKCDEVAAQVNIRPEFEKMLKSVQGNSDVRAIVVTCGLRRVWVKVLEKAGLSDVVQVIGSGRFTEGFVVTPEIKKYIVERLQKHYHLYVWAFGDSETDLPMLQAADDPVLVIDGQKRSHTTQNKIKEALSAGLRPRQVIMPNAIASWLADARAPVVNIKDLEIRKALNDDFQLIHTTDTDACKLLATPMRDASISSAALRKAHQNAGEYLARQFIAEKISTQQYDINHVQEGKKTDGYRLFHESKTTIVALMRGGAPMALGVSEVFPQAMFVHAAKPENLIEQHLQGQSTVILVDSVINGGETAVKFVKRVRQLRPTIQILVVTGVAQKDAVKEGGGMEMGLVGCGEVTVIALRVSENSYTGQGGTDTGARLFNTTDIEKEQEKEKEGKQDEEQKDDGKKEEGEKDTGKATGLTN